MFCPKCGTENVGTASFCRACGVDISFVPQAMTGQLRPTSPADEALDKRGNRRGKNQSPPDIGKGIESLFLGVGFLFVALAIWRFMPGGFVWWFWMLIPAFSLMGGGVSQIVRAKHYRSTRGLPPVSAYDSLPVSTVEELSPPSPHRTAEIGPPPLSVTEGTTRHLTTEKRMKDEGGRMKKV